MEWFTAGNSLQYSQEFGEKLQKLMWKLYLVAQIDYVLPVPAQCGSNMVYASGHFSARLIVHLSSIGDSTSGDRYQEMKRAPYKQTPLRQTPGDLDK